jgi:hypothetical protein
LKRAIERFLVYPLATLVATEQIKFGDVICVDAKSDASKLVFSKKLDEMLTSNPANGDTVAEGEKPRTSGASAAMPQPKPARKRERRNEDHEKWAEEDVTREA